MTESTLPDDIPADLSPRLRELYILITRKVEEHLGPILEELAGVE
jgi:hypothetical protein